MHLFDLTPSIFLFFPLQVRIPAYREGKVGEFDSESAKEGWWWGKGEEETATTEEGG